MPELLYWSTAIAALFGVWLNIKKHPACFVIWTFTNGVWVYADFSHGINAQGALQAVYLVLAIYGLKKWTIDSNRKSEKTGGRPQESRSHA